MKLSLVKLNEFFIYSLPCSPCAKQRKDLEAIEIIIIPSDSSEEETENQTHFSWIRRPLSVLDSSSSLPPDINYMSDCTCSCDGSIIDVENQREDIYLEVAMEAHLPTPPEEDAKQHCGEETIVHLSFLMLQNADCLYKLGCRLISLIYFLCF